MEVRIDIIIAKLIEVANNLDIARRTLISIQNRLKENEKGKVFSK